jgi:hypothetical protein
LRQIFPAAQQQGGCRAGSLRYTRSWAIAGKGEFVSTNFSRVLAAIAVTATISSATFADDDFPIVGTYAKDQVCKGDGSSQADALVRITRREINSSMGQCTILGTRREGKTFMVHVECKVPGDQVILGDVTFTQRDDNALDFDDQDHTAPAVLHKCGQ